MSWDLGNRKQLSQERRQRSERKRDAKFQARGYGTKRWRTLRRWYLAENPICKDPHGIHGEQPVSATVVDHVIDSRERPDLMWDSANFQALCTRCHNKKTGKSSHLARRATVGGPKS